MFWSYTDRVMVNLVLFEWFDGQQWRSEGGTGGGGICPRAPLGGGRQNPAKEFLKIYIS